MKCSYILFSLAIASPAYAQFDQVIETAEAAFAAGGYMTGQDLYASGNRAFFKGYVLGVYDADRGAAPRSRSYCVPDSVKSGQLTDVAFKYFEQHPEIRHESAAYVVRRAFLAVWSCPVRK
jgi:hypothetical protein